MGRLWRADCSATFSSHGFLPGLCWGQCSMKHFLLALESTLGTAKDSIHPGTSLSFIYLARLPLRCRCMLCWYPGDFPWQNGRLALTIVGMCTILYSFSSDMSLGPDSLNSHSFPALCVSGLRCLTLLPVSGFLSCTGGETALSYSSLVSLLSPTHGLCLLAPKKHCLLW